MADTNRFQGELEVGRSRLSAISNADLNPGQQRRLHESIAEAESAIQDIIQTLTNENNDEEANRIGVFYRDASTLYYQSTSFDIRKIENEIAPQLKDLATDVETLPEIFQTPLLEIIDKAKTKTLEEAFIALTGGVEEKELLAWREQKSANT